MHILPARRTFGAEFGRALGAGASEGLEEGLKRTKLKQTEKKENERIKEEFGVDLTGMSPETKKAYIAEALKGAGAKGLAKFKEEQKRGTFRQKLKDLGIDFEALGKNLAKGEPEAQKNESGMNLENLDEKEILGLELAEKGLGTTVQKLRSAKDKKLAAEESEKRRKFESERDYHAKRADKIIENAEKVLEKAPIRKGLINQQRRDIASGETSGILPYLVEKTGLESYRTPEASRFKTASKQRFIENLSSLGGGARPNQFIEQQLVGAQASLGRSEEANQTILDMEEFIDDMEAQRAKYELEFAKEDRENEKIGFPKNDIGERAQEKMADYAEKRQDKMAYDIRQRHEEKLDDEALTSDIFINGVPKDTPLTKRAARILMIKNSYDESKAYKEALKLGFKIPLPSTYEK